METTQTIVENVRSNMNNQQRIHKAILRLLEARNFDEFIHIITMDLSAMLDTDISVLVVESNGQDIPHIHTSGIRVLPEGTIDKLVQSQALLRIDVSMDTPPAIVAFGSRDPNMFSDDQGTEMVTFLALVMERAFRSWLQLPQ